MYSFSKCGGCCKYVFSSENEVFAGKCVKCCYQNCDSYTTSFYCKHCGKRNVFTQKRKDLTEGEELACKNCNSRNVFSVRGEYDGVYARNITFLKVLQGSKIKFVEGEKDENFFQSEKLLIDNKVIYGTSQDIMVDEEEENGIREIEIPIKSSGKTFDSQRIL